MGHLAKPLPDETDGAGSLQSYRLSAARAASDAGWWVVPGAIERLAGGAHRGEAACVGLVLQRVCGRDRARALVLSVVSEDPKVKAACDVALDTSDRE